MKVYRRFNLFIFSQKIQWKVGFKITIKFFLNILYLDATKIKIKLKLCFKFMLHLLISLKDLQTKIIIINSGKMFIFVSLATISLNDINRVVPQSNVGCPWTGFDPCLNIFKIYLINNIRIRFILFSFYKYIPESSSGLESHPGPQELSRLTVLRIISPQFL